MIDGNKIEQLFLEFDARKTKEAIFAYQCDKLESDFQSKLYVQDGCVDLEHQNDNSTINEPLVKYFLVNGDSWSEMWIKFGQIVYPYAEKFLSVSNYALNNELRGNFIE